VVVEVTGTAIVVVALGGFVDVTRVELVVVTPGGFVDVTRVDLVVVLDVLIDDAPPVVVAEPPPWSVPERGWWSPPAAALRIAGFTSTPIPTMTTRPPARVPSRLASGGMRAGVLARRNLPLAPEEDRATMGSRTPLDPGSELPRVPTARNVDNHLTCL